MQELQAETTACPKKHVSCLNGYCGGATNPTFPILKLFNSRDINLEFGTKYEQI